MFSLSFIFVEEEFVLVWPPLVSSTDLLSEDIYSGNVHTYVPACWRGM